MRVNVILHGVFGYVFRQNNFQVYTPAVCGHIYRAGGKDYKKATSLRRLIEYTLTGVAGDASGRPKTDPLHHPVLPIQADAQIDCFDKRFCSFRLPYPREIKGVQQFVPVDAYVLGKVYAGRDATPLNSLEDCPSCLILVYERDNTALKLLPDDGSVPIDLGYIDPNPGGESVNVHIWCTTDPEDMAMAGMTPEGHIRKAFAALLDMFPHEITIEIPDGFSPTACDENLPEGVTRCDVDPGRPNCPGRFGKVNCHYSMVMITA
jgi:hypothetical protein